MLDYDEMALVLILDAELTKEAVRRLADNLDGRKEGSSLTIKLY
jgi:hypothetical protein